MHYRVVLFSGMVCVAALTGCGKKETKAPEPAKTTEKPVEPAKPKGLGVTQAELMKGVGEINLEQADMKTAEGNVYMGKTSDAGEPGGKFASLVVYGTPDNVTHVYYAAALPYADFPDAAAYPDYMKRNLKLQDTLLANLFGGKIPDDIKAGLDWAKSNPDKDKMVSVEKKNVKLTYGSDKKIAIDVK